MTGDDYAARSRSRRRPGRELQRLWYWSFNHAQGDQPVQVHVIECCLRLLRERGESTELPGYPADAIARFRLPDGHIAVPQQQVRAQAAFWWRLLAALTASVTHGDTTRLPDPEWLEQCAVEVGGTKAMSSFTDEELAALAVAIEQYRGESSGELAAVEVVDRYLVPNIIRVELGFQGHGTRWSFRPRSDGGDAHASRLLEYSDAARRHHHGGVPTILDRMVLLICRRLDQLAAQPVGADPVADRYRDLLEAYNNNHRGAAVALLHAPAAGFGLAGTAAA